MSINHTGSQSAQPDLDWSQLKETVLMINLAVSQVDQSMHEGSQSVDTLASSFTYLAQVMCDMQDQVKHLPEGDDKNKLIETINKLEWILTSLPNDIDIRDVVTRCKCVIKNKK